MQPRLLVKILILKSERLMRVRVYLVLCGQFSPSVILPRPKQVTELVGLLPRYADLVGVVVVGRALMPDLWLSRQPENANSGFSGCLDYMATHITMRRNNHRTSCPLFLLATCYHNIHLLGLDVALPCGFDVVGADGVDFAVVGVQPIGWAVV